MDGWITTPMGWIAPLAAADNSIVENIHSP